MRIGPDMLKQVVLSPSIGLPEVLFAGTAILVAKRDLVEKNGAAKASWHSPLMLPRTTFWSLLG